MRLLLISSEYPPGPGGIGDHAHQLAVHLGKLGWEITVVSPQDYVTAGEADAFNANQTMRVVRVSSGGGRMREGFRRVKVANGLVKREGPDVLVGTGLSGVWVAAVLKGMRRLPFLAVAHGSEFGGHNGVLGRVNRWAFERADVVVAVSQFTKTALERAGIRPRQIEVITNAADPARFPLLSPAEREEFRKKAGFNGGPVLLTIGHVSERKGQEVVIRAMPEILKRVPNAQYLMLGLPTLQPKLARIAEALGVSGNVRFLGRVREDEKVKWLNCCDLFLMTSRTQSNGDCEGFGIAVVEAALCGKPAVVSRQSGLIEAIEDNVTGLAVPENDPSATADAVVSLLTDPARRTRMGEAARERAVREQTWDKTVLKYDQTLRKLKAKS